MGVTRLPSKSRRHVLAAEVHLVEGTKDWAVLCHGLMAHKGIRLFQTLMKHLPLNTVAIDFHCNGDSTGAKEDWSLGGYQDEAYDDLEGAIEWVEQEKHGRVLMIIGHSRGANVVLLHACKFDRIPFVVSLAARYDLSTGLESYFESPTDQERLLNGEVHVVKCAKQFPDAIPRIISAKCLRNRLSIDNTQLSTLRNTRHVFLVHGTADETIPLEQVHMLASHVPDGLKTVIILPDGDHSLRSPNGKKGFEPLLEEFTKTILPAIQERLPSSS